MGNPKQIKETVGGVVSQAKTSQILCRQVQGLTYSEAGYLKSLYIDKQATETDIKNALMELSVAFPSEDKSAQAMFYALLTNRIIENGFTTQRLKDAVKHLIDTSPYRSFSIADIIGYDKKIKLYTYSEYAKAVVNNKSASDDFVKYGVFNGVCLWYRKSEYEKSKLNM